MSQPVSAPSEAKADIGRILKYAPEKLIGREAETKLLHDAWAGRAELPLGPNVTDAQQRVPTRPRVLTFVALGGEGKTSLVAKWAAELAAQDWPGCDAAFAWSFYSQGTREQLAASSDLFLKEALTFFGDDADKAFAASPAGAFEKGQRLARIVGQRRSLLILDGLEPLQFAPTSPTPGQLKDQGIAALLKGLAAASHGLCVVTTRYSLPDLRAFWQTTAPEVKLLRLSREAGVHLLQTLGVRGTAQEFATLVEDVKGHALTLTLLGTYLRDAHGGDIRKRDLVKLEEADAESDHPHHAFHVMDAYVKWLQSGGAPSIARPGGAPASEPSDARRSGELAQRVLAILRLLGLFDRPAAAGCLDALWSGAAILGLTEPLVGLNDAQRNKALTRLQDAKLLTVNRDASSALVSLDAHPHLREYFARQLRTQQPDVWRAAHRRLYEHLCTTTEDKDEPTLEDLQPLYQAVAHGCHAGLQQEACDNIYFARILRSDQYSWKRLGAFASDLGAVACFFECPWSRISSKIESFEQAWLLANTAFYLRGLGRLVETIEPLNAALEKYPEGHNWSSAAIAANNLVEVKLMLGDLNGAIHYSGLSMNYAERNDDAGPRIITRATHAEILHQAGRPDEAHLRFIEAERMQVASEPRHFLLYSLRGFQFCDLFLATPERTAWQLLLCLNPQPSFSSRQNSLVDNCHTASERATQTLKWAETEADDMHSAILDHLTLSRAELYKGILESRSHFQAGEANIEQRGLAFSAAKLDTCVNGFHRAGVNDFVLRALLTRAWLRFLTGARTGPESAQEDLDEAWEIAERGPMKLFLADIHLHRARLFFREKEYPWNKNPDGSARRPKDDLDAAEKLINACGYHRRDEELADAKLALGL